MKHILFLIIVIAGVCFAGNQVPLKMPDDFKIGYYLGGGTRGHERTIEIDKDICIDRNYTLAYSPEIKYAVQKRTLEILYDSLRKLNAFNLKYEVLPSYDSWGTTLIYTMNGEYYYVARMNDVVIIPEHVEAFKRSVDLILGFTDQCRQYNLDHKINLMSKEIPDTMPDDFLISYFYYPGKLNTYIQISLKLGECSYYDATGEIKEKPLIFKIDDRIVLEKLYHQLKNQDAFTLWNNNSYLIGNNKETTVVNYTIKGKAYELVLDNIVDEHKEAFNTSVQLILKFAGDYINK